MRGGAAAHVLDLHDHVVAVGWLQTHFGQHVVAGQVAWKGGKFRTDDPFVSIGVAVGLCFRCRRRDHGQLSLSHAGVGVRLPIGRLDQSHHRA